MKKIIVVLFISLVLRLVAINQSLWLDEAIGALAVRDYSYTEIISDFIKADNHPPLYYLTLKLWTNIFGYSELALRSMSVLFGVGTVYLTYLIATKLNSRNTYIPATAALLFATSQLHIYYSQEARMYAMAAFFAALSFYSFIKLTQKLAKKRSDFLWWITFSLSITVLVFVDYVPIFLLPVFWLYAIVNRRGSRWWKKLMLSHLPIMLIGVWWLPTLLTQIEHGNWLVSTLPAWKEVAGGANIKQALLVWMKFVFGRISFVNKLFYYSLVSLSSIPFVVLLIKSFQTNKKAILVWMWLVVPLALGFTASFWFPAFVYFRFLYVLPSFYLLLAHGVGEVKNGKLKMFSVFVLISVNLLGSGIYYFDHNQQREQWRQAVGFIEQRIQSNEAVIFSYPEPFAPYKWYSRKPDFAAGVTDSISATKASIDITEDFVEIKSGVYYFEYLKDLSDSKSYTESALQKQGFKQKEIYDFGGVGHVKYFVK